MQRKDFTVSEIVAIKCAIEPKLRKEAKKRISCHRMKVYH
jgi:hypothetical protein